MKTEKIIGIPGTKDDGIEMELSTKNDCINEICELRKAIQSIYNDLEKFKGMNAYNGKQLLTGFENKYIEDAMRICENQLDVNYVTVTER